MVSALGLTGIPMAVMCDVSSTERSEDLELRYPSAYLDSIGTSFRQGKTPPFRSELPRPRDFSRALYTFDIGQNDLVYGLKHSNEEQVRATIPDILDQFSQAVQVSNKQHLMDMV
ncbi:hypothetical protein Dsin_030847 [Dipteronia sinensis]|uniref:GDSL esterase/lipase n=1 Tax=Dipteronia sinensis TaxID=43782 RepID=A0AAD9ZJX4_9ROSI|nr:hypothetical protein Dsin_030847 [Dipteronia sinensis]